MSLVTQSGSLIQRNGSLGIGLPCCCSPSGDGGGDGGGDCTSCAGCNNLGSDSQSGPAVLCQYTDPFTGFPRTNFASLWSRARRVTLSVPSAGGAGPSMPPWSWNEGYPAKLSECNYRWVEDETRVGCCPFGATRVTRRRWSLVVVDCVTGRTRDITAAATTGLAGNVVTLNTPNTGLIPDGPCGEDPGFFPGPGGQLLSCSCFREGGGCTPNRYSRAVVSISHSYSYGGDTRPECVPFYEEWSRIYESDLSGTFTLLPDPLNPSRFIYETGEFISSYCQPEIYPPSIYIALGVEQPSPNSRTPACNGRILDIFAGTSMPANTQNCNILFRDFGYRTMPGLCWLNNNDCPLYPGYQTAQFTAGARFGTGITGISFPYCEAGEKSFFAQGVAGFNNGDTAGCNGFSVTTLFSVTLQDS